MKVEDIVWSPKELGTEECWIHVAGGNRTPKICDAPSKEVAKEIVMTLREILEKIQADEREACVQFLRDFPATHDVHGEHDGVDFDDIADKLEMAVPRKCVRCGHTIPCPEHNKGL